MVHVNGKIYLVYLLLLYFVDKSKPCPSLCRCRSKMTSCENLNLTNSKLRKLVADMSNKTEILFLNHNILSEISIDAMKHLKNLKQLHIRGNFLTEIPSNKYNNFPMLEELNLQENKIKELTQDSFLGYNKLKTLSLQSNKLEKLRDGVFSLLSDLKNLYLESNEIKSLSSNTFNGLTNLTYLSINDNQVKYIPDKSFERLHSLRQLFFHSNRLTYLPALFLSNLKDIMYIDFSGNQISHIDQYAFSSMKNKDYVDVVLFSNYLRTLNVSSFENSTWLKIDISGNILDCNCRTFGSLNYLTRNYRRIQISGDVCVTPKKLQQKNLSKLTKEKLNCNTCQIHICENRGICRELKDNTFECKCSDTNYTGKYCHIKRIDSCLKNKCQNNAICSNESIVECKCHCREGFEGRYCEIQTEKSTKSSVETYVLAVVGVCIIIVAMSTAIFIYKRKQKKFKSVSLDALDEDF